MKFFYDIEIICHSSFFNILIPFKYDNGLMASDIGSTSADIGKIGLSQVHFCGSKDYNSFEKSVFYMKSAAKCLSRYYPEKLSNVLLFLHYSQNFTSFHKNSFRIKGRPDDFDVIKY